MKMLRFEDFCCVPEGEGKLDREANYFVVDSPLPVVKVMVNELKKVYEARVFEIYPTVRKGAWEELRRLFPLRALLRLYRGKEGYIVEVEEGIGVEWKAFTVIQGGRPIKGKNAFVIGLYQEGFPTERYTIVFFLEDGELLVEEAVLEDGTVVYKERLYEKPSRAVLTRELRRSEGEPLS